MCRVLFTLFGKLFTLLARLTLTVDTHGVEFSGWERFMCMVIVFARLLIFMHVKGTSAPPHPVYAVHALCALCFRCALSGLPPSALPRRRHGGPATASRNALSQPTFSALPADEPSGRLAANRA